MSSDISTELRKSLERLPEHRAVIVALLDEIEIRYERVIETGPSKEPRPLRVITNEHVQLKDQIAQLESKNATLNRESAAYKKEREKLQKQLETQGEKLQEALKRVKELEREVVQLNASYEEQEEEIMSLRQKLRRFGQAG
jgi:predicted RNase H-like nuclease (RuvC/YqgF family)